jgi:hypothetical protein
MGLSKEPKSLRPTKDLFSNNKKSPVRNYGAFFMKKSYSNL